MAEGDRWYFPPGIPHSIQGLQPDGCGFLPVFSNGGFFEDSTSILTDWLKYVLRSVLANNVKLPATAIEQLPKDRLCIFDAPLPAAMQAKLPVGVAEVPTGFSVSAATGPFLRGCDVAER